MSKMQRSFMFLTLFALLTAGLLWWIFGGESLKTGEGGHPAQLARKQQKIFKFIPDRVHQINIERGQESIELFKDQFSWQMRKPLQSLVDQKKIEQILQTLRILTADEILNEQQSKAALEYVLPEKVRVTLSWSDINKNNFSLELAAKHPSENLFYIRCFKNHKSLGTFLVSPKIQFLLSLNTSAFLGHNALFFPQKQILAIHLRPKKKSKQAVEFELRALPLDLEVPEFRRSYQYIVSEPSLGVADRTMISNLFTTLNNSPMTNILVFSEPEQELSDPIKIKNDQNENKKLQFAEKNSYSLEEFTEYSQKNLLLEIDYWLLPKSRKIRNYTALNNSTLLENNGSIADLPLRKVHLSFVKKDENQIYLYRKGENYVTEISSLIFSGLLFSEKQLFSKRVLSFERESVYRLEIIGIDGGHYVFEREHKSQDLNPVWNILAPKPSVAKTYLVAGLILQFSDLEGLAKVNIMALGGFEDARKRLGFSKGIKAVLQTKFEDKKESYTLYLAKNTKNNEDKYYVYVEGKQDIFEINNRLFQDLSTDIDSYVQEY